MLILAALAPPASVAAGDLPLVGTVWRWSHLEGPDPVEVPMAGRYTLELLPEGRYVLRADCNTGSGAYTREGDRLELLPGPMTAAECGPESLSARFVRLLGQTESFAQDGDRLGLQLAADAGHMELVARRDVALDGSAWVVRSYNNQKPDTRSGKRASRSARRRPRGWRVRSPRASWSRKRPS
jgi:heat shock protein HslJ